MPLPWLILSEGSSDEAFFRKLIGVRGVPNMQVRNRPPKFEGNTVFERWLASLIPETGYEKHSGILIVADNDSDPAKAFAGIKKQIRATGRYGVPTAPRAVAPAQNGLPAVAVLMMPWDEEPGCLETLCLVGALKHRRRIAGCIGDYVHCVGADDWPVSNLDKLRMRCYLSSMCKKNPNTGLQYAWTEEKKRPKGLIRLTNRCFDKVAAYLAGLPVI